jgi:hypothetical protein
MKRLVMSFWRTGYVRPEFGRIACFEKCQIQMPLSRQVLHILEVHIEIPCEFAQGKIMRKPRARVPGQGS